MSITTLTRKNAPLPSARRRLVKTAAALALVAAAMFATPSVARAYVPTPGSGAAVSSSAVAPGGTVDFSVKSGTFAAGETVTIYLSGENASGASLAMIRATGIERQELGVRQASADGALPAVAIKLPANAAGLYEVIATSPSVPNGVSASFSVTTSDATSTLSETGFDSNSLMGVWLVGGGLLLSGVVIVVVSTVRRGHRDMSV